MSKHNDGGTAFPVPNLQDHEEFNGMSLRDYFAAKCCAAMVSTIQNDGDYTRLRNIALCHDLGSVSEFFAQEAYKQADALLKERAK